MDEKLERLAQWSVGLEISGTSIQSAAQARKLHIADSLAGIEIPAVRAAARIVDIGSGAGFPGLVLAAALPEKHVVLVDSVRKKMEAAAKIARELELENVECVWGRAEEIAAQGSPHREAHDVVTARALAQLNVLLEYASPLLALGGSLVAWKGAPSEVERAAASVAAKKLGFGDEALIDSAALGSGVARSFYVAKKQSVTPPGLPRRPGIALKRPIA